MELKEKQTLAEILEVINEKLDEIINVQEEIQKELKQKNKVVMQRMNKLQEYNEIDDMRTVILSDRIETLTKKVFEIESKLY